MWKYVVLTVFAFLLAVALAQFGFFDTGFWVWTVAIAAAALLWSYASTNWKWLGGWREWAVAALLVLVAVLLNANRALDQIHDLSIILVAGFVANFVTTLVMSLFVQKGGRLAA